MGTSGGTTRSKFAGGDQTYLRDEQYKDASKLTIRADLHRKYTVAELQWFDWLFPQFDLRAGHDVLEVGCGPGFVWEEAGHPTPADMSLTLNS